MEELLAGRYELHEVIGRGGMGIVRRGRDRVLQRDVAIKLLPIDRADDPVFVARFEREALSAALVQHPNIVTIFDQGHDGGAHYIVMEYLRGRDLARLIREDGPQDAAGTAAIGAQVAAALAAAHRVGVIHRDIKAANIIVDADGRATVLDFGIARALDSATLTATASVIGSAAYLAPEVTRGAPADARSDVYALGCVLYELLEGHAPFRAEHPAAILHQHASAPVPTLPAAVPADLRRLVTAMLAKDPAARPASTDGLADALAASAGPGAGASRRVGAPGGGTAATRVMAAGASAATAAMDAGAATAATRPLGVAGATAATRPLGAGGLAGLRRLTPRERGGLALAAVLILGGLLAAVLSGGSSPHRTAAHVSTTARHGSVSGATATRTVSGLVITSTPIVPSTGTPVATTTPPQTAPSATTPAPAAGPGPATPPGQAKKHAGGPGHGHGGKDKGGPGGAGPPGQAGQGDGGGDGGD